MEELSFIFWLRNIQKKNEKLTILPVGFGDTKCLKDDTLTTSWSGNLLGKKVGVAVVTIFITTLQLSFFFN